jgi:hypothetical protein
MAAHLLFCFLVMGMDMDMEIPRAWRCCLMHFTPNEHDWVKWFIQGSDSCDRQEKHFNDDMNVGNGVYGTRMFVR